MKYTLIELVQTILAALEDDEVNSINDTPSALQVAGIVKETYFELLSELDLPEHYDFIELTPAGGLYPTIMTLPENVLNLNWIKYDNQTVDDDGPVLKDVPFKELDDYLKSMYSIDAGQDNAISFTYPGTNATINILGFNDAFPINYTCYDDHTLIFNAYNATYDNNLVSNKTLAYGLIAPTFTLADNFTPNLDAKQFSLLLAESKAQAFEEIEKKQNMKAEKRARRGWIRSQRDKQAVPFPHNEYARLPHYGRKRP